MAPWCQARDRRRVRVGKRTFALIVAVYVALAVAITWPWVLHPTTVLTTPLDGDVASSVALYQTIAREGANPFTQFQLHTIGWPHGLTVNPTISLVSPESVAILWGGSVTVGALAIHSIVGVLGFILTASVAAWLTWRITSSLTAGFFAGLILGFWPQMYIVNSVDTVYSWMWLFLLPVAAWMSLIARPSRAARAHRRSVASSRDVLDAVLCLARSGGERGVRAHRWNRVLVAP